MRRGALEDGGIALIGSLHGVRVLDLTRNIAGPYCTMLLGDLGAQVVKVERPDGGDDTRRWHPPSWAGYSATYLALNRNKMSIAVDLRQEEGRAIVVRLAEETDVLVESFRHGSLRSRGLDYEAVQRRNPRIVYCSITGFGAHGPHRERPAYDALIQAYSGIASITGESGRPPIRVGPSIVDMGTGLWATIGIVTALYARTTAGQGCHIKTSLLETGVAWLAYQLAGYMGSGITPGKMGSMVPMIAPYEVFATADDYFFVAAPNDAIFTRLCATIGLPELAADERFSTNAERVGHRNDLHVALEDRFRTAPAARWESALLKHDIPCSLIHNLADVLRDPQIQALDLMMRIPHDAISDLRLVNMPLTFGDHRASNCMPPPELGQHSDEILNGIGYRPAEIERLRRKGIVR